MTNKPVLPRKVRHLLGLALRERFATELDSEIAADLGLSYAQVGKIRREMLIPRATIYTPRARYEHIPDKGPKVLRRVMGTKPHKTQ